VIDLHSHILPAVDDGARNIGESLGIARAAAQDGTTVIAATPHVRFDYPTTPEEIRSGVEALNELLVRERVPVRVVPGAEIDFARLRELEQEELAAYGLGGNPRVLLVECPYRGWPEDLLDQLGRLRDAGFTVVLAHPERNDIAQSDIALIELAVESGTLIQVTAGSLVGEAGRKSRRTAEAFLARGLCHLLASDVHGPGVRRTQLGAARGHVGDDRLARWLTEDVPGAILAGDELPKRPSDTQSSGGRRLFGRRRTPG
jgi:protein-tyrosine phosphatase